MLDMEIFREYDIRGIFGKNLTQEVVSAIGMALGEKIKTQSHDHNIFIGYDARKHSTILYEWLKNGLSQSGIEIYFIGLIPTPVAYFATCNTIKNYSSSNSIMITGSHNPPEYNGFKITLNRKPFYGQDIKELSEKLKILPSNPIKQSSKTHELNALQVYQEYLIAHFDKLKNFPYPIALDYGNGVASVGMEAILKALNIKHTSLFATPDGNFPNHHPDPSEEKNLIDLKNHMKTNNIPIGLAFDGDGDRIALLTSNHSYKGDELAILFAQNLAKELKNIRPLIIGEVKCSKIMYDEIDKIGQSVMYKTGHSNLKVKLKEINAHLAVEMSGHMFFNDRYFGYDDAIYAGLRALELFLTRSPNDIETIIAHLPQSYSTPEEKVLATEESKFIIVKELKKRLEFISCHPANDFPKILEIIDIDGVRVVFEKGWGLVRASNTMPVLVTRFEANDEINANFYKNALLQLVEEIQNSTQD